jgi:hypothetical protein
VGVGVFNGIDACLLVDHDDEEQPRSNSPARSSAIVDGNRDMLLYRATNQFFPEKRDWMIVERPVPRKAETGWIEAVSWRKWGECGEGKGRMERDEEADRVQSTKYRVKCLPLSIRHLVPTYRTFDTLYPLSHIRYPLPPIAHSVFCAL